MPDTVTPTMKEFPLINRYHAAWLEHGTRITQRQSALNMHLVSCGVMFGYFVTSKENATLLLYGVTAMTLATTAILWMHHRIMQRLCSFMSRCEKHAKTHIRQDGSGTDELFYFHAPSSGKVTKFHASQRLLHRVLLTSILWVVHLGAAILAYASNSLAVMICGSLVLVSTMLTYVDLYRDRDDNDE
jgi:hypothetical protein